MPELNARDPGKTEAAAGEVLGHVHSVTGAQASIGLLSARGLHHAGATVGKFIKIHTGKALLIGVITDVSLLVSPNIGEQRYCGVAHVDLTGEIGDRRGKIGFRRGVTDYPSIGDAASALTSNELRLVFETSAAKTIKIGQLQQDSTITVAIDVDEMLSKHFAVLGPPASASRARSPSSCSRFFRCGPTCASCCSTFTTSMAAASANGLIWSIRETCGCRSGCSISRRSSTSSSAAVRVSTRKSRFFAEVIPQAKITYTQYRHTIERAAIKKQDAKSSGYTVDTPVPYRLADWRRSTSGWESWRTVHPGWSITS